MEGNWGELNQDLLHLISKKLGTFSNLIRFRSVCKQWRIDVEPTDLRARLPWLLQPDPTLFSTDYRVFSVSSKTTSQIKLPINHREFGHMFHKAPSMGFLLVNSFKPTQFLLNPLTETKLHIPFPKGYHRTIYMGPDPNSNSRTVKEGIHLVVLKLEFEKNPINSIMFWQSNNDKITTFRIPLYSGPALPGYYKGKLFVTERLLKKTSVFDMETGAKMNVVIPNPGMHDTFDFFIEAMGDLLGVVLSYFCDGDLCMYKLKVYQLKHTDEFEECTWIELQGIGDRVLFLNTENQGFCLSTSDFKGFRGNCIYYLELVEERNKDAKSSFHRRVLRYNMEDGTKEELLNFVDLNATWFVPSLD
ncbi:F-box protein skip23 [Rhynchospora pubera]|uniref:F-box protein skip23 n=1 Tax=Rhynchospora pubera TaxID=906938 RepID=A0AAV8FKW7_9POAL|nr:F-box protein skip23 [Rhynchospora pubera]